jgi:predicted thioesterase
MLPEQAELTAEVTADLVTVHLPPERAVLMTPAIVGLIERCLALTEAGEGSWVSTATSLRHRAGLKTGALLHILAHRGAELENTVTWNVEARGADGTLIGEGTHTRRRSG